MAKKGYDLIIVYLDDFLIIGPSYEQTSECLNYLLKLLRELGFAISYSKVVGPTNNIKFLGVIIDSVRMVLELPSDKLEELQELVEGCLHKKRLSLKCLQQLAGKLNWASQVVRGGRSYVRRILDSMKALKKPYHKAIISDDVKADLRWWGDFLRIFNGKVLALHAAAPHHIAYTDASNIAAGLYFNTDWAYLNWALDFPQAEDMHINYKETVAIFLAALRWGPQWSNSYVTVYTDNVTAKSIVNKGTSKNPKIMPLIRKLFWLSALYNFYLKVEFIPGADNIMADTISRLHENGNLCKLEALINNGLCYNSINLNLALHISINGLLFLHPQIAKWIALKLHWMQRWPSLGLNATLSPHRDHTDLIVRNIQISAH
jgi:hypothetical protein